MVESRRREVRLRDPARFGQPWRRKGGGGKVMGACVRWGAACAWPDPHSCRDCRWATFQACVGPFACADAGSRPHRLRTRSPHAGRHASTHATHTGTRALTDTGRCAPATPPGPTRTRPAPPSCPARERKEREKRRERVCTATPPGPTRTRPAHPLALHRITTMPANRSQFVGHGHCRREPQNEAASKTSPHLEMPPARELQQLVPYTPPFPPTTYLSTAGIEHYDCRCRLRRGVLSPQL